MLIAPTDHGTEDERTSRSLTTINYKGLKSDEILGGD
jgi:hypothetical protein